MKCARYSVEREIIYHIDKKLHNKIKKILYTKVENRADANTRHQVDNEIWCKVCDQTYSRVRRLMPIFNIK